MTSISIGLISGLLFLSIVIIVFGLDIPVTIEEYKTCIATDHYSPFSGRGYGTSNEDSSVVWNIQDDYYISLEADTVERFFKFYELNPTQEMIDIGDSLQNRVPLP